MTRLLRRPGSANLSRSERATLRRARNSCIFKKISVSFSQVQSVDDVFSQIYAGNVWGRGSGEGSEPVYCQRYVQVVEKILQDYAVCSVLDLGCGDWLSGFARHVRWGGARYVGMDVVPAVIEQNQQAFGSATIQFQQANILSCDLPAADLLLIKDVLQHWSNASVVGFLPKLRNFKLALITNDVLSSYQGGLNQDIPDGGYRPVDLLAPPFNVPGEEVTLYTNASHRPAEPIRWVKKMVLINSEKQGWSEPGMERLDKEWDNPQDAIYDDWKRHYGA
jgi:SAM-dependent methyltransferase